MKPRILILHATGTNRDREAALAFELAGGAPEIVHLNRLAAGERSLSDYQVLALPGGFSYGDDLGAGKLWAVMLRHQLGEQIQAFVESGRPVIGICNGFQVLVKAGLLPGLATPDGSETQLATLTRNDSARFECRWVYLQPQLASPSIWTAGLDEPIYCPVAHGEGKFVARDATTLAAIERAGLVALRYASTPEAAEAVTTSDVVYPWNPNGSQNGIAGICNASGTILGLMPHPEDHILPQQHPRVHRGERGLLGLPLFINGVRYAAQL
ncbi:MAG: phosphoribosylformylglycinamidine synthase I [Caldilineales bacterium]